jgi:hypothetical protein
MLTLSKFVDKVFCYRFADSNRYLQARFGVNDNRRAVATNALGDAPRLSQDARLIFFTNIMHNVNRYIINNKRLNHLRLVWLVVTATVAQTRWADLSLSKSGPRNLSLLQGSDALFFASVDARLRATGPTGRKNGT